MANMVEFVKCLYQAGMVTIHGLNEVAHSLDVIPATLYEAIAEALSTLRSQEWVGGKW